MHCKYGANDSNNFGVDLQGKQRSIKNCKWNLHLLELLFSETASEWTETVVTPDTRTDHL